MLPLLASPHHRLTEFTLGREEGPQGDRPRGPRGPRRDHSQMPPLFFSTMPQLFFLSFSLSLLPFFPALPCPSDCAVPFHLHSHHSCCHHDYVRQREKGADSATSAPRRAAASFRAQRECLRGAVHSPGRRVQDRPGPARALVGVLQGRRRGPQSCRSRGRRGWRLTVRGRGPRWPDPPDPDNRRETTCKSPSCGDNVRTGVPPCHPIPRHPPPPTPRAMPVVPTPPPRGVDL